MFGIQGLLKLFETLPRKLVFFLNVEMFPLSLSRSRFAARESSSALVLFVENGVSGSLVSTYLSFIAVK